MNFGDYWILLFVRLLVRIGIEFLYLFFLCFKFFIVKFRFFGIEYRFVIIFMILKFSFIGNWGMLVMFFMYKLIYLYENN